MGAKTHAKALPFNLDTRPLTSDPRPLPTMPPRLVSLLGLLVMVALAWLMSSNKRRFPWRVVFGGLALQFALAGEVVDFVLEQLHIPQEVSEDIIQAMGYSFNYFSN